jgi:7,8-dihydropterin-6-yl-methyl-4-(beta-D-ribofuranosyl)aminobenzene 5'-phosphate synthase
MAWVFGQKACCNTLFRLSLLWIIPLWYEKKRIPRINKMERIPMNLQKLHPADKIEITILVDNYTDVLLPDAPMVKRLRVAPPESALAEHGFACLVTAYSDSDHHTILMDAGISGTCLQHNAKLFSKSAGVQKNEIGHRLDMVEAVVLSHGHFDHCAGMPDYLRHSRAPMPLVVHPEAFVDRCVKLGPDLRHPMPPPDEKAMAEAGAAIEKRKSPSTLAEDYFLVTGEVERVTDFEKGAAYLEARIDGQWVVDPFKDDQGIVMDLKDRGLVVIGGCSHSGIINMVKHAKKVTGLDQVFAVLGGFHLTGADESVISRTIGELKQLGPRVVAPMHCTGWKAINAISEAMPDAFVLNSVGTTYVFESYKGPRFRWLLQERDSIQFSD